MNERSIYVIRHGSTEMNEDGRIRGHANVPLSPMGRDEVKKLGKALRSSNIGVIYSSDLDRARDTAEAVSATTGAPVYSTKLLRPWDLGDYTGRSSQASHPAICEAAEHPDVPIKGGESFNAFRRRAFRGITEALAGSEGKPLALVTHHRVERLLQAWHALGQPNDHSLDLDVMFEHGENPAHAEKLMIALDRLALHGNLEGADVEGPDKADGHGR